MQLSEVRNIYDARGPFATIYLESRSPAEDAPQQVRLRWDDLKGDLEQAGADEHTVTALESAIIVDDIGEVQNNGRVLIANESGILLNESWGAHDLGDAAYFTQEPQLGTFLRDRARAVRLLVAIADRTGAVIRQEIAVHDHDVSTQAEHDVTDAADASVHKPREGAFSHKQIQRRADEATKQNLREVAEHMDGIAARWSPDAVILAGEVQGRNALKDELSAPLQEIAHEADRGGTDDDAAEQALSDELRDIAAELTYARSQKLANDFEQAKAHGLAAEGAASVSHAGQMGAIEQLLLEHDRSAEREAKIVTASVQADAQLGLIDTAVQDAVAAILRFEITDNMTT